MASLTDARCTCPAVWRGHTARPACPVHETTRGQAAAEAA